MKEKVWLPKSVRPRQSYICLWRDENDRYVVNEDMEFLSAESFTKGDKDIESQMRQAARYYGVAGGRPIWTEGRKITKEEWEVQMERLQEGLIPDEREAAIAEMEEEYIAEKGIPRESNG